MEFYMVQCNKLKSLTDEHQVRKKMFLCFSLFNYTLKENSDLFIYHKYSSEQLRLIICVSFS